MTDFVRLIPLFAGLILGSNIGAWISIHRYGKTSTLFAPVVSVFSAAAIWLIVVFL